MLSFYCGVCNRGQNSLVAIFEKKNWLKSFVIHLCTLVENIAYSNVLIPVTKSTLEITSVRLLRRAHTLYLIRVPDTMSGRLDDFHLKHLVWQTKPVVV